MEVLEDSRLCKIKLWIVLSASDGHDIRSNPATRSSPANRSSPAIPASSATHATPATPANPAIPEDDPEAQVLDSEAEGPEVLEADAVAEGPEAEEEPPSLEPGAVGLGPAHPNHANCRVLRVPRGLHGPPMPIRCARHYDATSS